MQGLGEVWHDSCGRAGMGIGDFGDNFSELKLLKPTWLEAQLRVIVQLHAASQWVRRRGLVKRWMLSNGCIL